ncbi:MAG TPA: GGDEF domain-containing protein [Chitinophagales bacterium]|nr:GGDEF domain-containing protein [Chitinophagales bacterium]
MKYVFLSFVLTAILKFLPVAKGILESQVSMNLWVILILSISLAGISFIVSYFFFKSAYKEIQAKNHIDELTELKNHKALELELDYLESSWKNENEPISIILFDIDNFKKFNDDNSYEIADKILAKIGRFFAKDNRITDETYRYFMRGDEFLIVAKKTSISNARIAADRKRKSIEDSSFEIDGKDFKLTVSCGVTEFNKGEPKTKVLDRVNKALQNAKKKPNKNSTETIV